MARETGKQRSQRIQIDYYRKQGGLHQLKIACLIAGLAGAGFYAVYVLAAGSGAHTSTGPLTVAHASFENDCQQCHQDFTPIDSRVQNSIGSWWDWIPPHRSGTSNQPAKNAIESAITTARQ